MLKELMNTMIEVKNLKLDNNLVYFSYKSDLDDYFKDLTYNIKTDEIIESEEEISNSKLNCIYHAIKEIKEQIKNNNLQKEFKKIWY